MASLGATNFLKPYKGLQTDKDIVSDNEYGEFLLSQYDKFKLKQEPMEQIYLEFYKVTSKRKKLP